MLFCKRCDQWIETRDTSSCWRCGGRLYNYNVNLAPKRKKKKSKKR